MQVTSNGYGDFIVHDEMPFSLRDIDAAAVKIMTQHKVNVDNYPITIDFNQKTEFWEVWFTRPVSDEEYVQGMSQLPDSI